MNPAPVGPAGDFRFLLPSIPKVVAIAGSRLDRRRLEVAGVRLADPGDPAVDTAVAAAEEAEAAAAVGAPQVALFRTGPNHRRVRIPGYDATSWFALGSGDHADGYASPRHQAAARYAVGVWRRPSNAAKARILRVALRTGIALPGREVITVGVRPGAVSGRTDLLGAAGLPAHATGGWFLATPGVEPTSRVAGFVFDEDGRRPWAVLKVLRIPDVDAPFVEDARGLGLVRGLTADVAAHVPQVLARGRWDGHHASIETAAVGRPLSELLRDTEVHEEERVASTVAVAEWAIALAAASVRKADPAAPTRRRLGDDLATAAPDAGPQLLAGVADAPAVVTHGDLGTWNVMTDGSDFTVLDWEAADEQGLPLADLAYFLSDALALVGGARTVPERVDAMVALFAGRHSRSALLFGLLRRAADAVGIGHDVAGRLVTLSWLHHAVLPEARRAAGGSLRWPAELVAERWRADPDLGLCWRLPA